MSSRPHSTESMGQPNEPVWDIAHLYPTQGNWTEDDYLELDTSRLVEFSHGYVEVLPRAGITEYWIVDPETKKITVLALDGKSYRVHGVFEQSEQAQSALFAGFSVSVNDVMAAGESASLDA